MANKVITKQVREFLKCELSINEVATAANDLARLLDDKTAIEEELQSIKASFKAKLEKCDADIRMKQRFVRDKFEYRQVECDIRYDQGKSNVITVRKDTGEVTETRDMTQEEKQMKMEFKEE